MDLWSPPSEYGASDGVEAIVPRMAGMVRDMGLEHFSFLFLKGSGFSDDLLNATLHTSYPTEWVDRYVQHQYWKVDPVTDLGKRSIRPFIWGQGPFLKHFAKPQQLVFEEAGAFDIKFGLTIPIRGIEGELSVFTVVSNSKSHLIEATREAQGRIFSAAVDTHERALENMKEAAKEHQPEVKLSKRELECLSWTLEGKTAGEIATILGISVSTVNQHASSASNKLGSLNKHHAAVQALRKNLIQ